MNKKELITKHEHQLTLRNYSISTIQPYLNILHTCIGYLDGGQIHAENKHILSGF